MKERLLSSRGKYLSSLLFICFIFIGATLSAQVVVKGKVADQGGNAISGVSVTIKSTDLGTTTNESGSYSLVANLKPGNYVLVFSSAGLKTLEKKISLPASGELVADADLSADVLGLDEVVVTGATVRTSKKELGNAISTISARQMQNTGAQNLSGILNGRVMGAQVTQNSGDAAGGFSVRLRGVGSIFGSSEPLYIVDGVIIDNSSANVINLNADAQGSRIQAGTNRLADLNPNDIERIEVINGPAAAAIYGSRASNGVVQIFTKRGKSGKPQVTFTTSANSNSLRKRVELNDYPFRFGIASGPDLFTAGDRLTMVGNLRPNATAVPGTGPQALGAGRLDRVTYPVTRYDYQDQIFNTSYGTDNFLSVNGGNEGTNYYLSTNYTRNGGIIRNTNFQRYGVKARVDSRLSQWAKIAGGVLFSNTRSKDLPNGNNFFSPISTMNIIDNVWDITARDAAGNLKNVELVRMNPNSVIETYDMRQNTNRMLSDLKLTLTPMKGLSIDLTTGFDTYAQEGTTIQPRVPYAGVSAAFFPDGYVSAAKFNYFQWTGDAIVSYKTATANNDLQSTTTAGYSAQYISNNFQAQEGRDLLPFVTTINAAQNFFSLPVDNRSEQSIFGYFLQQTLGYKSKLFLTLAGRFDGSSAFGTDARNIFYPKASISYNVSDEAFFKNASKTINTLKLRASWGKAGNLTGIGAYDRFTTYRPQVYTGGAVVAQNRVGNPNIRPEIKTEFETGAEMSFLKGRLGLQFSIYNQEITDLVLPFSVAPSTGASSLLDNVGVMTNKGIELMLTGTPVQRKGFRWDASFLYNRNRNEITELYNNAPFISFDASGTQGVLVGQPVGVYFINYFARNADGSWLMRDVNGFSLPQVERGNAATGAPQRDANGQPTGTPLRKVLGDPNPDFNMTIVNEFTVKNWSLRLQFDGVYGFEVYNWDRITRNNVGVGPLAESELRGEVPRGTVAAIGGFIGPRIQEYHVQDGSFTKLREMAIGYTINKLKFCQNMKIALVGRNLFSFDKYDEGFDPEVNSAGQSIVRGTDFGSFPIPRVLQLSITTNF
jgi:TonB-linked SusC/RagA family outer membrane protein